jgi:hypothetical protein
VNLFIIFQFDDVSGIKKGQVFKKGRLKVEGVGFKIRICSACQRLADLRKNRLEDAINHFFSCVGGLDEPQTARSNRLFACGSEEQRDDSATQTNEILKEQLESNDVKLKLSNIQRRKLAKTGKKLGRQRLMQYASIVTPDTLLSWHRRLVALKYTAKRKINTERQEEMALIKELCVKFAEENLTWGYGRIQGALENLGYTICEATVANILKAAGILPAPERMKKSNWTKHDSAKMVDRRCARRDVSAGALWAA